MPRSGARRAGYPPSRNCAASLWSDRGPFSSCLSGDAVHRIRLASPPLPFRRDAGQHSRALISERPKDSYWIKTLTEVFGWMWLLPHHGLTCSHQLSNKSCQMCSRSVFCGPPGRAGTIKCLLGTLPYPGIGGLLVGQSVGLRAHHGFCWSETSSILRASTRCSSTTSGFLRIAVQSSSVMPICWKVAFSVADWAR